MVLCSLLIALVACSADTSCRKDLQVNMVVTLQADSLNVSQHNVRYTAWDSVTVQIVGESAILLDNAKGLKRLPLLLQPSLDTTARVTAFAMTYHEQTDTLYVKHSPRQYFVSLACGCVVYHTITDVWSTDCRVDSVQIINASVENAVQENLRIYLHE